MDITAPTDAFTGTISSLSEFEGVAEPRNYTPLPETWLLANTDIVGSTMAIEGGGYKSVNMAGASVISALVNATGRRDLPFVFGGDGALVAVPGDTLEVTRNALAATRAAPGKSRPSTRRPRSNGPRLRRATRRSSEETWSFPSRTGRRRRPSDSPA